MEYGGPVRNVSGFLIEGGREFCRNIYHFQLGACFGVGHGVAWDLNSRDSAALMHEL